MALVGVGREDTVIDIDWMVEKIVNLRIFETEEGKLDKSLLDTGGSLLLVSQFTLYGDCRKGRRPSFSDAMGIEKAREFFDLSCKRPESGSSTLRRGYFEHRWT